MPDRFSKSSAVSAARRALSVNSLAHPVFAVEPGYFFGAASIVDEAASAPFRNAPVAARAPWPSFDLISYFSSSWRAASSARRLNSSSLLDMINSD